MAKKSNCAASAASVFAAASRTGCRNPRTGDRVEVPSKHVAYFTPGRELKALINRDPAQPDLPPMSE